MWPTSAPPVFDIMSFDMAAGLVGILASVASGAWDQRCWEQSCAANFRRISAAVAGTPSPIAVAHLVSDIRMADDEDRESLLVLFELAAWRTVRAQAQ